MLGHSGEHHVLGSIAGNYVFRLCYPSDNKALESHCVSQGLWGLLTGFQGKLQHGRSNKPAALEKGTERFPDGGGSFANLKSFVGEGKSSHNRDLKPKCINPVGFCLEQLGSIFTGLRIIDLNS